MIAVLSVLALGLGYWYGLPKEGSGGGGGKNGIGKKEPDFLKKGLVAYYPFNGDAKDESGNGNDGEIIGATLCTNRFGKADSAFAFDSKDFVRVDNSFGKSLTIASWGQLPNPSIHSILWCFVGNSLPVNLYFFNGKIFLNTNDSQDNPFTTYTAKTNTWTHYVTVISPDRTELFIDGEKLGQAQYRQPSEKPFFIGMNRADYPWIGQIDDVRIYNRALSAEEVKGLYDLEKPKGK